jgi:hypothetical protein
MRYITQSYSEGNDDGPTERTIDKYWQAVLESEWAMVMRCVTPEPTDKEAMQTVLSSADAVVYMGRTEEGRTMREVSAEEASLIPHPPCPSPFSLIYFLEERDMFVLVKQASDTSRAVQKASFMEDEKIKAEVEHKLN